MTPRDLRTYFGRNARILTADAPTSTPIAANGGQRRFASGVVR
jgi:hypothetical protein